MEKILNQLTAIPGVVGAYIYHPEGGVLSKEVPSDYTGSELADMGQTFLKIFQAGDSTLSDVKEIALYYKPHAFTIRPVLDTYYTIVIHKTDCNSGLISVCLDAVRDDLSGMFGNGF